MYFQFDKRTLYIILGALLVLTIINLGTFNLIATLLTLPGVILALSFHEFAHAFVSDRLGDTTPRNQGRLTLDPLKHIDPVGIFLLIFAHIGWGKPVQINPKNFSKISESKGEALVALAGPVMNFILAFILMIIFYVILIFVPGTGILASFNAINIMNIIITIIYYAIIINIGLGVFNLIPIPPLDGSKIFLKFLPYRAQRWIDNNMQMISLVFMVLFIFGILGYITSPVISVIMKGMQYLVEAILSIFI
ncbi:MAG: site-2 protease family protein [Clostridia bacterium]|nr:site-2 protease family protein [Clostridia bacterium]